ncbi:MAG: hypothetical protein SPL70_07660 [Cyanobacteriota bacterium]|nr:hypothetical protein [Cyanobacteriota bacterium]
MEINYFDLSGGINLNSTKTELGINNGKLFWADAQNIEIYSNRGLIRQKGNSLFLELPIKDEISGMCEMESQDSYKLVITTVSGKIYIYRDYDKKLTLLDKTLKGRSVKFKCFLNGILVATETDSMFYIKDDSNYTIEDCNLLDLSGNTIFPECIEIYQGRVWCADKSTIYYSALGTYNDFQTENDAGYINNFHTDIDVYDGICCVCAFIGKRNNGKIVRT